MAVLAACFFLVCLLCVVVCARVCVCVYGVMAVSSATISVQLSLFTELHRASQDQPGLQDL